MLAELDSDDWVWEKTLETFPLLQHQKVQKECPVIVKRAHVHVSTFTPGGAGRAPGSASAAPS
ncbi:hypothetical protein EYF80_056422 [Liparis tanakae]|uniref:Uncharacterized protein n=1 Tax=Liparis tanakae TaxID=230148 RepID=A0A4Z2EX21_9TELE|nr:hypothetical protein EYF80_056422 [Liparis tanakae]